MGFEPESLEGVALKHHRVNLSGVTLHVAEAGSGDRLVVLLHGFPELWFSWRSQLPALAKAGFRVLAPDMRGYNTSGKPPRVHDYDVEKLCGDVAVIQAMGAERADVVGHDWGGVVAWSFAMLHGDRLRKLTVMNAPHPLQYQKLLRSDLEQLRKSWYVFFFQLPWLPELGMRARGFQQLRNTFRGLMSRGKMSEDEFQRYVESLSQPGAITSAVNYYRAAARRMPASMPRFTPVQAPVQVIWGMKDQYLKPVLCDPPPKWAPNVRVDRLEANHFVQMDAPDEVNRLLVEFLGPK